MRMDEVLDGRDHSAFAAAWLETARRRLVHPASGLLVSSFHYDGTALDGPEGSSIWMVAHMLEVVDPAFARDQYERAKKELGRAVCGFGYAAEWPASWRGEPDVDSGPRSSRAARRCRGTRAAPGRERARRPRTPSPRPRAASARARARGGSSPSCGRRPRPDHRRASPRARRPPRRRRAAGAAVRRRASAPAGGPPRSRGSSGAPSRGTRGSGRAARRPSRAPSTRRGR